jgi:hypothetical protein
MMHIRVLFEYMMVSSFLNGSLRHRYY